MNTTNKATCSAYGSIDSTGVVRPGFGSWWRADGSVPGPDRRRVPTPNLDAVRGVELVPTVTHENVLAAWTLARQALNEGRTITYGEVSTAIGVHYWKQRQTFYYTMEPLIYLDFDAAANIVRKDTGRPGPGFYEWLDRIGHPHPTRDYPMATGRPAARNGTERALAAPCQHNIVGPCDDCTYEQP